MTEQDRDVIRQQVRVRYGGIAQSAAEGCCCGSSCGPSCCAPGAPVEAEASERLGYSAEELASLPEGADMGLGCGNPQAIAGLQEGETVLDLGSGGGLDCFLAARQVGELGLVIGVDMTPDMLSTARANAARGGYRNVEFRLGEIEHLPVADDSVDVIMSNCVINLSPDKPQVFREAYRVLAPGGRLAISDIVATEPLPRALAEDIEKYMGCVAGATPVAELQTMLREAGFVDIDIALKEESREFIRDWFPGSGAEQYVVSALIQATKPACCRRCCCQ
jgi:SAM-dependent methyltransferase